MKNDRILSKQIKKIKWGTLEELSQGQLIRIRLTKLKWQLSRTE